MPDLPAPNLPANDISYADWLAELDRRCRSVFSLGLADMSSLPTAEAYRAGVSPPQFFDTAVVSRLREIHGSFVDAALADVPDVQVLSV